MSSQEVTVVFVCDVSRGSVWMENRAGPKVEPCGIP